MTLDLHTLFLVTIYVEAILSLLLLFVWAQNMALRAVCWWGFAYLIQLASIWLFGRYGAVPDLVSIDLANALLFTAFAAGEESSAVLTETSREKEVEVAERIRESFAQMAQDVDGHPVCATLSIELVHCQERTLDIPSLLRQADHALYCAKERGRNRVEVATVNMMIERTEHERAPSASSVGARSTKSAA